ncbi:hypothetical protein MPSEU_000968500 [Mayamaea pseudoterrestris]|nr:hypothetical protein MPSEU_000968500 [Mayamaea pseudoterrestris]
MGRCMTKVFLSRIVYIGILFLALIFQTMALSVQKSQSYSVGFDLGTSGARISVVSTHDMTEVYTTAVAWDLTSDFDSPDAWMQAIDSLLSEASNSVPMASVKSICFSGTSASCLTVDAETAMPTRPTCMYNYNVVSSAGEYGSKAMKRFEQYAPPNHVAVSATGSLAKLLAWNEDRLIASSERLCHQADYVALQFCRDPSNQTNTVSSDWHNCLKLGYDVRALQWPEWMAKLLRAAHIPLEVLPSNVVSPGDPLGTVRDHMADRYGLPKNCIIAGGTTDSNAAFFAAVGSQPPLGTAVTSLGSTLAIKQLSSTYIEDSLTGVYSHRFPSSFGGDPAQEAWLAGGASNVGCAILRQLEFTNDELDRLSQDIDPMQDSPMQYYPLVTKGERFPVADGSKEPILEPRPDNKRDFLHGILQGISDVERDGFLALGRLGATPNKPTVVRTCGGGSRNDVWIKMRQRRLRQAFGEDSLVIMRAENTEASYGAALLAVACLKQVI